MIFIKTAYDIKHETVVTYQISDMYVTIVEFIHTLFITKYLKTTGTFRRPTNDVL